MTAIPGPSASVMALSLQVILTGAAFEPVYNASWYVVRSLIDGATPESAHVTVKGDPPGKLFPAVLGTVKATSPNANGTDAKSNNSALLTRMMKICGS